MTLLSTNTLTCLSIRWHCTYTSKNLHRDESDYFFQFNTFSLEVLISQSHPSLNHGRLTRTVIQSRIHNDQHVTLNRIAYLETQFSSNYRWELVSPHERSSGAIVRLGTDPALTSGPNLMRAAVAFGSFIFNIDDHYLNFIFLLSASGSLSIVSRILQ